MGKACQRSVFRGVIYICVGEASSSVISQLSLLLHYCITNISRQCHKNAAIGQAPSHAATAYHHVINASQTERILGHLDLQTCTAFLLYHTRTGFPGQAIERSSSTTTHSKCGLMGSILQPLQVPSQRLDLQKATISEERGFPNRTITSAGSGRAGAGNETQFPKATTS